ncbi:MAG: SMP-30/gluconolactonase/LRE family protein [archaeon]|nr:SMP-30/gluconolactonase/LRE family protein [archaeon]MCP8306146.1 SMP-30/gluconolactonase/LRE family protein [archaeon]
MNRTRLLKLFTFALMIVLASACVNPALAQDPGDYIVTEFDSESLARLTPEGGRGVIYEFDPGAYPWGVAIDSDGNYIVTEYYGDNLVKITPEGVRTVIYEFDPGTTPTGVAIDSDGNYIVAEGWTDDIVKITPEGVRTVIYEFDVFTFPGGVAIDSDGNYIVTGWGADNLVKITPGGARTVIYEFDPGTGPDGVAIDSEGNYIVAEGYVNNLVKITPEGVRTVIYEFDSDNWPIGVAIDSDGNYIVAEYWTNNLVKITPEGVRTVIFEYVWEGPAGVAIYPDLIPPTVSITSPTTDSYVGNTTLVQGTSEDTHSGIKKVEVKIDDGSWQLATGTTSWSCSLDTTGVSAGSHTITARATDNNDNTATTSVDVIVDNLPPTLSITSPTSGSKLTSSTVTVMWTGSDAGSGIDHYEVKLDGGSWIDAGTATSHEFTGVGDGSHTVRVKAVDEVGNSKEATVNFTVSTGIIFGLDLTTLAIIGAAIVVVIVVVAYLILRGRRPPTPAPPSSSPPVPPPT